MSSQENVYFSNDISQTNDNSYVVDGDLCEEVSENLLPTNIYKNTAIISNDINIQDSSDDDNSNDNNSNDDENSSNDKNYETESKPNQIEDDTSEKLTFSENSQNKSNEFNNDSEFIGENSFQDNYLTSQNEFSNNGSDISIPEKKKRGPPKSILANQQKYLEILEKQNRMLNKNKKINNQKNQKEEMPKNKVNTDGPKRRVIIGGKVKYLPISKNENNEQDKQVLIMREDEKLLSETEISNILPNNLGKNNQEKDNHEKNNLEKNNLEKNNVDENGVEENNPEENDIKMEVIKKRRPMSMNKFSKTGVNNNNIMDNKENTKEITDNITETERKIPSAIAKKMEMHAAKQAKEANLPGRKKSNTKKIPSKYAKQMENDVKKQTVRNVKSFSDLRRIKTLQDISSGDLQDTNKASMTELRKLRMEQKKREQAELRKRAEENKRESAIQEILKNDKMSKFAQVVAIKNLSVNSRNRRRNVLQNKADKY
ncbi:hypothetical protein H012_gp332 [Acanthamoeba polyphaga moumouvirus]|uniref:Uncharacterized protein n=1 Tax=Acanthamoeba polyphaga moumouvirus TaxID=1269028 RepID=L7RDI4_9VIRU|nr:hypothetical protein H012_gp332 [Acanthamoeba polyphaga moumouvirus]AGC02123.1 hypothetical protein Moumou_00597 [Acanthamoeba polyphaga moumouvirus]